MKRFFFVFFILLSPIAFVKADVIYLDPVPNSQYVSIFNSIIIGLDNSISENSLNSISINVTGSKSGLHTGRLKLSSDNKKILFTPSTPFDLNEVVTINIISTNNIIKYNSNNSFEYSFTTESKRNSWNSDKTMRNELGEYYPVPFKLDQTDPPQLTVTITNNPSPGKIFVSPFGPEPSYLLIAENNGTLYHNTKLQFQGYDFKRQDDGTLTYFESRNDKFYQMNSNYQIIDSFACGNGYTTDLHELVILPNKHALLMSYDPQTVDMSQIVAGGDTAATVVGLIIQELDADKNVVFQWRSWDHFQITDVTNTDLTAQTIDYVHGNAIHMDNDGNLMISSRNMDEITKIDRNKGSIIWRLGGINNQFTFINDPLKFSRQHCIRRIDNGNIILFDNGNFHSPSFSRAVEYSLDEGNHTATLVWEYRNTPSIYAFAMGSVQRLENGNTFIGWGYTGTTLSEVTPEGQVALEMKLPASYLSYRAFKFDWDTTVTSITNSGNNSPELYSLNQNYPNPFNPTTSISFSLPKSGNVTLKVYDIMGREVAEIVNSQLQAGNHEINFNAKNLSSGIYIYKLETDNFTASKKMILMK